MIIFCLAIIFTISGSLLFLKMNRGVYHALHETPSSAIITFIIGGLTGDAVVLWLYFRKSGNSSNIL
jgi:hypothetical protein